MSEDQTINLLGGVAALVLVVSALSARRLSFGQIARSLLGWAAIAAAIYVGVMNRHEIGQVVASVNERLGLDEQQVEGDTVRIRMSPDGHFWARVDLNGVSRRMLIDSGATTTAISEETARAAGVDASRGFPVTIETANGAVEARKGRIDEVGVGPLRTDDLGVVVSANFGDLDVLGMNFLSRLKSWRVEGNVLVLEPHNEASADPADATASPPPRRVRKREDTSSHRSKPEIYFT